MSFVCLDIIYYKTKKLILIKISILLEQKRMTGQQLKKLFLEQEPQEFFKIKNLRKDFEKCISLIGSKIFSKVSEVMI